MRKSVLFVLLSAAVGAAAVSGCGACRASATDSGAAAMDAPAMAGTWTLRTLGGQDIADLLQPDARAPFLAIGPDGVVSGFAGVNTLRAQAFPDEGGRGGLFGPVVTTRMAGPESLMGLEARMLKAMDDARSARVSADELRLLDSGGRALATFGSAGR